MALSDIQLMAHLFRRAGFGATRDTLEAAVAQGYLECRLQGPAFAIEPRHPFGRDTASRDIRQDVQHRCAVAGGMVELEAQTPKHMHTALRIHHFNPLLSKFPRLYTAKRAKRRDHLKGEALALPNDKASPASVQVAEKLPRTEVAIGNPEVTGLHRAKDRSEQRTLLGMPVFPGKHVAHHAPSRVIDDQRLAGQGASGNPSQFFSKLSRRQRDDKYLHVKEIVAIQDMSENVLIEVDKNGYLG